jgi:hypothetical protein
MRAGSRRRLSLLMPWHQQGSLSSPPRHCDFERVCRANGCDPFVTLNLVLAGSSPDIHASYCDEFNLEPEQLSSGEREDRNEFLRFLHLPQNESSSDVESFEAGLAFAIRGKARLNMTPGGGEAATA